ncbi:MAG: PA14 domain-containing protein [Verrucomicrobiales bacterium]|nr:PA14 domain-containing protein [Verrucomicrobiales bacterium]
MLFLNTALILGTLGILIPIIIHLLNRQSNKVVDWGAMNFLLESLAIRNRRIQLEEALLMAARCLLVGLVALALARPFIPPGSTIPWMIILPLLLIAVVGIGVAVVLHNEPKWRYGIGLISTLIIALCVLLILFEKKLNLSRFNPSARQDIALIIDGSTSMMMKTEGLSNFQRAVDEARAIVKRSPRGHAFSLILAGPSPSGKILDPTTDRAELDAVLESLTPLDGPMATYHALTLASLSLARGDNPAKQIILFTDEQDVGWETGKTARWNFLRDAFKNLPSEPQIMIRKMPLPDYVRNLAVSDVQLSRKIVGVDRPVEVSVTVENTGNEAVTPGSLILKVDGGRDYTDKSLGQLQPGEKQTVKFYHQFSERGAHSMTTTLEVADDILEDNSGSAAINVAGSLKVLLVDGHSSNEFFDRAATFSAIALAPSRLTLNPQLQPNKPPESQEDDDFYAFDPTLDPVQFLVEPKVVAAPNIAGITKFDDYDVVILADVPRLPAESAEAIRNFVQSGGGLFVAAGQRAIPEFYNEWKFDQDTTLLPGKLAENLTVDSSGNGYTPSTQTLTHPALAKVVDPGKSDFNQTIFTNYRSQAIPEALKNASSVGARLNNGDILLSSRNAGRGKVVLMGTSLDTRSGNFVTRQAFLPFIHELTYQLANPAAYDLNLDPGWEVNIGLAARKGTVIGEGLTGEYFASHNAQAPTLVRQDKAIQFNWGGGSPAAGIPQDNFKIRWSGKIQAPETGTYKLSANIDDSLEVRIDNRKMPQFKYPGGKTQNFRMEAKRWYDFEAIFYEGAGEAKAELHWESKGMGRRIIPPGAFRTFSSPAGGEQMTGSQSNLAEYAVEGPGGIARKAKISSSENGSVLKLEGDIASGLYHLKIPGGHSAYFSDFLRVGQTEIPFTVKRDSAESYLTKLTDADYQFLEEFVTLAKPQTLEELIGFLNGNQFGQELWKWLILGGFIFLLVEIILSRWIAKSRRMGEEITVTFDSKTGPSDRFHEQLVKMGKA